MMKQAHTPKRTRLWLLAGMGVMLMAAGGAGAVQMDDGSSGGTQATFEPDPAGRAHRAVDEAEEAAQGAIGKAADAARDAIDTANETVDDAGEAADEVRQKAEDEAAWASATAREVAGHAGELVCENSSWAAERGDRLVGKVTSGRPAGKAMSALEPGPQRSADSSCSAM